MVVLFVVDGSSPIWTHVQAESLEQKHARLHSHDKRWCQHVPTMSDLTARRGTSNLIGDDCRMSKGFELRVLESPLFPTSLCGVLVFGSVSRRPSASHLPSSHSQLVHTQLAHIHLVLTHLVLTQLAHTQLVITQLAHTQLVHTQLAHIHLVLTHLVLTQLSHHTTCSHNLLTHNLSSHTLLITQLAHSHTTCPQTHNLSTLRGRRGTYGTGTALVAHRVPNDTVDAAALCVAGVALGDIDAHLAGGQAYGTWWHRRSLCVAALGTYGSWAGSVVAPGSQMTPWTCHGSLRWQAWHLVTSRPSLCVAGVALGDIDRHFAWHLVTSTLTLRGRLDVALPALAPALVPHRGSQMTPLIAAAVGVAGVALGDIDRHFAWQAWHLVTSTAHFAWQVWHLRHWAGSHTIFDPPLCHTHMTHLSHTRLFAWQAWHLGDIDSHFAWQAWHLAALDLPPSCVTQAWHFVDTPSFTHRLSWHHLVTSTLTLRGRRGTCGTGLALTPSLTHHFVTHHLSHTVFHTPSFTHNFVTHTILWHFVTHHLSHTTLSHTVFVTHHLSHTTLSHTMFCHTIFHTQLCHTPSFAHTIFHTPSLSHTIFHTQLCHTPSFTHHLCHTPSLTHHLSHTIFHTTLSHTIFHTPLCRTTSFTNHLSHTTLPTHTIFDTPSFTHHLSHHFVTHHLSHTTLSHTTLHIQLVLLLDPPPPPSSFLPCPFRYNICCPLLEEVDMWLSGPLFFCLNLDCTSWRVHSGFITSVLPLPPFAPQNPERCQRPWPLLGRGWDRVPRARRYSFQRCSAEKTEDEIGVRKVGKDMQRLFELPSSKASRVSFA